MVAGGCTAASAPMTHNKEVCMLVVKLLVGEWRQYVGYIVYSAHTIAASRIPSLAQVQSRT
eukprot:5355657-Pleurochrysis_carterae.AAC.1